MYMKKIVQWLDKNVSNILAASIIGLAALLLFASIAAAGESETAWHDNVIRLHILAADNTPEEQELKIAVRDGVWSYVSEILYGIDDQSAARETITKNISQIQALSQQILHNNGSEHDVRVALVQNLPFPNMVYGTIFLPQARYEALQIIIGEGGGNNWWCIMFPTLCLTDLATAQQVQEPQSQSQINLRPRLRIAELIQNR